MFCFHVVSFFFDGWEKCGFGVFLDFFPHYYYHIFFALSLFFILSINVTNIISRNKFFRKSMNLLGL